MRVLAVIVVLAGVARADEPDAAARYDRGAAFFREGNYAAALTEFEAVYRETQRWEVLYNIGVTQRKLFRYHHAVQSLQRYLDDGGAEVEAERRVLVETNLKAIQEATAVVVVTVPGAPAQVEVDDWSAQTGEILVAPGRHTVIARRAGEKAAERVIDVVSGQRVTIELRPTPIPKLGILEVRTVPDGAAVFVDDKPAGRSPWAGEVAPGGHKVGASLRGYDDGFEPVLLLAGQQRRVTLVLHRSKAKPKPWYRSTAFIVGSAVVGVGLLGVGGYFLLRPEQPDVCCLDVN